MCCNCGKSPSLVSGETQAVSYGQSLAGLCQARGAAGQVAACALALPQHLLRTLQAAASAVPLCAQGPQLLLTLLPQPLAGSNGAAFTGAAHRTMNSQGRTFSQRLFQWRGCLEQVRPGARGGPALDPLSADCATAPPAVEPAKTSVFFLQNLQ